MATQAQIEANRANAQLSTGPKTPEGKQKVSLNAVKNALTGATVLLPTEDAALYQQRSERAFARWQPFNDREEFLVQSIVDTEWRLLRIPALESGIIALARLKNPDLFSDQEEPLRSSLLAAHIDETCARQLRNLQLQESRLTRKHRHDTAELERLQAERRKEREKQLVAAARMYERFKEEEWKFDPAKYGFEFSIEEIEEKVAYFEANQVRCQYPAQYAKYFGSKRLMCERLGLDPEAWEAEHMDL